MEKFVENVICPDCKYQNKKENIERYGTCKLCGRILDKKKKFDYEMFCKLRRWRKK
ncbi:MAG: hypothetical protein IIZ67_02635 [Bacilli bacterium]|nr:hypothetical protein [Bacilli bacterium]